MTDCDCRLEWATLDRIFHCPKHAAVDDLIAALTIAERNWMPHYDETRASGTRVDEARLVRAVLARATGGTCPECGGTGKRALYGSDGEPHTVTCLTCKGRGHESRATGGAS